MSIRLPLVCACLILPAVPVRADFAADYNAALAQGHVAEAEALAGARLSAAPADEQARFALGAAQFLGAIEALGQGLYRYGVNNGEGSMIVEEVPFLRLPLPTNPAPEQASYTGLRTLLAEFVEGLGRAEATLAAISDAPVKLPVRLGAVRLDFDGDGKGATYEGLAAILATVAKVAPPPESFTVHFDESDVPWLRGYAHLLSAMAEFPLAHDWQATFDQTFHSVFPQSDLPSSELWQETLRTRNWLKSQDIPEGFDFSSDYEWEDLERWQQSPEGKARMEFENSDRYPEVTRRDDAILLSGYADLLAFVRLIDWPVVEPERLSSARRHLLSMIALSRESWRRIKAETDDDLEWVPAPRQTGPFPDMRVNDDLVTSWHGFLDGFEGVLEGRLLLPHWRFQSERGLNIRRMMEEPRRFDLLMILHGAAALPYIEVGKLADGSTMDAAEDVLFGGLLAYFLWFN
jgi:hypothetical protein